MEKKNVEELITRYDNVIENLEMNFKFIEWSLGKITLSEKELDEMLEHYKKREAYELCDKIIKKINGPVVLKAENS